MRYSPDELDAKFRKSHDAVSPRDFHSKPAYKKSQEFYCAARFGQALSQVTPCWLHVADYDEQTEADFHLEVDGKCFAFQITEVQLPGRRRGDEYKQEKLPRATLESWDLGTNMGATWIRKAIQKKFARYGGKVDGLNLLVYANFQTCEHNFEEICSVTADAASKFDSVWVLNGNAACCIKGSHSLGPARPWLFSDST